MAMATARLASMQPSYSQTGTSAADARCAKSDARIRLRAIEPRADDARSLHRSQPLSWCSHGTRHGMSDPGLWDGDPQEARPAQLRGAQRMDRRAGRLRAVSEVPPADRVAA